MENKRISERVKRIIKNRGITLAAAGKMLGMSKQGVSWVLNNRLDSEWKEKDKMWWSVRLGIKEEIFEIREWGIKSDKE